MNKKLAIIVSCFMMIATIGGWMLSKTYRKAIIKSQQETIEAQKDLKKSLKNQPDYIESINDAFDKTVGIEKGD